MRAAGLLAAVLAVAGCGGGDTGTGDDAPPAPDADPGVPDAMPREVITSTESLLPGQLVEGVMAGGPADRASIHLTAPVAELDWNIHGHEGGQTETVYEELNVIGADYLFIPTSETDWWLLIRNSGPTSMDVEVRVELYEGMTWRWE